MWLRAIFAMRVELRLKLIFLQNETLSRLLNLKNILSPINLTMLIFGKKTNYYSFKFTKNTKFMVLKI